MNACACLGPICGEPHCPCTLEQLGLERSDAWKAAKYPEALELERQKLNEAFSKVFGWNNKS